MDWEMVIDELDDDEERDSADHLASCFAEGFHFGSTRLNV
jgi:hypothetical protein